MDVQKRIRIHQCFIVVMGSLLLLAGLAMEAYAKLPMTVGGITLGDPIEKYENIIIPGTNMGNRDALFLNEMSIDPSQIPGTKGGSLSTGNSSEQERVIMIKLKFLDTSKQLYDVLEKYYREAFGAPDKWLGDAFHNVISWQWTKKEGDDVVEIVLTYSKDQEIRPGVSVKMVLRSAWQHEFDLYRKKNSVRKKMPYMNGHYDRELLEVFIPH